MNRRSARKAPTQPDDDLAVLKRSLYDFMHDKGYWAEDVSPGTDLLNELIPYMAKQDKKWVDLENDISFRTTTKYKSLKSTLYNQFKDKGRYLNQKLKTERMESMSQDPSQDNARGTKKDEKTPNQNPPEKMVRM